MRINLLPKEERPLSPKTLRWQFVVAFLGIILLLTISVLGFVFQSQLTSVEDQVRSAKQYSQVLQSQKRLVDNLQDEIQVLKNRQSQLEDLIAVPDPSICDGLRILLEQDLSGLWIEDVVYEDQKYGVRGYTFEMWKLSSYLSNISSLGWHPMVSQLSQDSNTGFITFVLDIGKGAVD